MHINFGKLPPNKNVMVMCSLLSSSIIRIELSLYIGSTSVKTVDKTIIRHQPKACIFWHLQTHVIIDGLVVADNSS